MNNNSPSNPIKEIQIKLKKAKEEMSKVIIGQKQLIDRLFIAFLAEGHLLLEGLPGVAKTLAANTFARTIDCEFKRIQFTPDLLPADLIGTSIYNPRESTFSVKKGPIFTQILLADEINRAPAKIQSALLEVMQEKQVTIAGETFKGLDPFFVIATQNPIELEGTYPLAEAQTDRFLMKIRVGYPSREDEAEILLKVGGSIAPPTVSAILNIQDIAQAKNYVNEIYVDKNVSDYLLNIIIATRNPKEFNVPISGLLEYGASPRAGLALKKAAKALAFFEGRTFVTPQDIKNLASDVLAHRLRLSYEAQAENISAEEVIQKILDTLKVP
jgi:MoxR-like ATPase